MTWTNVALCLPTEPGVYHVMREWDKDLKAFGQAFFDGTEWKDGNLKELAGPILAWMPTDMECDEDEV